MSARILIIDAVATSRIVLKVKMQAAQFTCEAVATPNDAVLAIAEARPDIILANPTTDANGIYTLCRELRTHAQHRSIGIIAAGVADTASARFAALDNGADDVMPYPVNDTYLMARIRSLLRIKGARQDYMMRNRTMQALGFEEAQLAFQQPAQVHFISPETLPCPRGLSDWQHAPLIRLQRRTPIVALEQPTKDVMPDLMILDLRETTGHGTNRTDLLPELKARAAACATPVMVIIDDGKNDRAAHMLDLGADDAVSANVSRDEIKIRCTRMIARKRDKDRQDRQVQSGLLAAVKDPLTGLYNRRFAMPHLNRLQAEAKDQDQELAVLMIDIDHFKSINDRFGHAAGDQVLAQIGQRLRKNIRGVDLVSRIGGEEFMVAMPRTTALKARRAANRLRQLIHETPFEIGPAKRPIKVSISVGVAIDDRTLSDGLCERADAALYRAKNNGRNQVALAKSAA